MKEEKDSTSHEEWRKLAKRDWDRIKRQLKDNDPEAGAHM